MADETSSSSTSDQNTDFSLQFLCSLIPKAFDGKRNEYNEFIANCDNAVSLSSESQKRPLLVYITSRLTGSVRTQLQGKTLDSWESLKNILNTFYQDKKHYIQLMEELNTLKQSQSESVLSYHERIDKVITRLLNSMSQTDEKGKIETIKELGLSRFIYHSKPDISRFLRAQSLTKMSDALNKALEEERALTISNEEFTYKRQTFSKYCNFCKKKGHITQECYRKQNSTQKNINFNKNANNTESNPSFDKNGKFCNYCKKRGHLIDECYKRKYNNEKRNQKSSEQKTETSGVNLNSTDSQASAKLWESDIQMA